MNKTPTSLLCFLCLGASTLLLAEETKKDAPAPATETKEPAADETKSEQTEDKEKTKAAGKEEENLDHGDLSKRAWDALNGGNHASAIELAESCIKEHGEAALKSEADLKKKDVTYPIGIVDAETKAEIHKNGVLNDVAACYFILGKSQAATEAKEAAKKSFTTLGKLTYGRVWDPEGWFWSPAETSADEILFLN